MKYETRAVYTPGVIWFMCCYPQNGLHLLINAISTSFFLASHLPRRNYHRCWISFYLIFYQSINSLSNKENIWKRVTRLWILNWSKHLLGYQNPCFQCAHFGACLLLFSSRANSHILLNRPISLTVGWGGVGAESTVQFIMIGVVGISAWRLNPMLSKKKPLHEFCDFACPLLIHPLHSA